MVLSTLYFFYQYWNIVYFLSTALILNTDWLQVVLIWLHVNMENFPPLFC